MKEYPIDRLIQKHPDCFTEDGKQISDCPEGWERIIDGFCSALTSYKASYRSEPTRCVSNALIGVFEPIVKWLELLFKPKPPVVVSLSMALCGKKLEPKFTLHGFFRKIWLKLLAKKKYHKVYPKDLRIDQVKEKFGGLRIYMNIYDPQVGGMIDLATALCDQTCDYSGEIGVLCKRGGWYKTLSLDKAQELGYTPIKQENV